MRLPEPTMFRDDSQSKDDAGQGRQNCTYAIELSLTDILNNTAIAVNSILYDWKLLGK